MRIAYLLAFLLILTGCPADDQQPAEDPATFENDMNDMEEEATWSANLQGQEGFEAISGEAMATVRDGQTEVQASVEGAPEGGTHPWHIHEGTCESGGGIVGDAGAYPALEIGEDGTAQASATINVELEEGQSYHVNVHASPDDLGTIVACGDLQQD